jgi:hypothetical protein
MVARSDGMWGRWIGEDTLNASRQYRVSKGGLKKVWDEGVCYLPGGTELRRAFYIPPKFSIETPT